MQDWLKKSLKELADTNAGMLIPMALAEDVSTGDITSLACVPADSRSTGRFVAKKELVVAGIELVRHVYCYIRVEVQGAQSPDMPAAQWSYDPEAGPGHPVSFQVKTASGTRVSAGQLLATVSGPTRLLLERERIVLNFLQHLSGIATLTRSFVDAVDGTGVRILDTRKTTPGWRILEKKAVTAGGGLNHRIGLWDGVLIKENHVAAAGGIRQAVEAARKIRADAEIEVRNLGELREAIQAGAKHVLLDNMSPGQVRECVEAARQAAHPPKVEVSGGVTLANVRQYALAGPDFISVGALTHSAPAADISFLL